MHNYKRSSSYFEKYFGMSNLPVRITDSVDSNDLRCLSWILSYHVPKANDKHVITGCKYIERMANWVTSPTDSVQKRERKFDTFEL